MGSWCVGSGAPSCHLVLFSGGFWADLCLSLVGVCWGSQELCSAMPLACHLPLLPDVVGLGASLEEHLQG